MRIPLTSVALVIVLQGCMSTQQLQNTDGLDPSDLLAVTTTSGELHSVTVGDIAPDGSFRTSDGTLVPRNAITSMEISKLNYTKTALTIAGIGAGIYAGIRFVQFVDKFGSSPSELDISINVFPW